MAGSSLGDDRYGGGDLEGAGAGARGGPLLMTGLETGVICVRDFQRSCITLLSVVESELDESLAICDDDMRVDDLKIVTDAELVDKALTEVLEGRAGTESEETLDPVAAVQADVGAQEAEEQQRKVKARKRKRKDENEGNRRRGRPYDRAVRGAHLTMNGDEEREEALTSLKLERDKSRENCGLNCLRVKKERDGMSNVCATLPSKFFTSALKTHDDEFTAGNYIPVEPEEVVLHVEIYHGMRRHMKTQEFMVLGSQFLTALRDKIYCLTDDMADKAGLHVPSGYFLIEDVFYDDMRDPDAVEYSVPFIQWIEEQKQANSKPRKRVDKTSVDQRFSVVRRHRRRKSTLPTLSSASMADTCFLDLRIKIGAPYMYCHQGDCKHTIIFRDLRLIHPEDVQNAAAYPVLKFIPKLRYRKCTICDIYRAKKVTYDDSLAPSSPCFFCENCYHLFHYSDENRLLHDDFKVFDYCHE